MLEDDQSRMVEYWLEHSLLIPISPLSLPSMGYGTQPRPPLRRDQWMPHLMVRTLLIWIICLRLPILSQVLWLSSMYSAACSPSPLHFSQPVSHFPTFAPEKYPSRDFLQSESVYRQVVMVVIFVNRPFQLQCELAELTMAVITLQFNYISRKVLKHQRQSRVNFLFHLSFIKTRLRDLKSIPFTSSSVFLVMLT